MRRTMIFVTYLSLLATIGSFIVSALTLLVDRNDGTRCTFGPDTDLKSIERPASPPPKETVRSKNDNSRFEQPAETSARALTQETHQFAWRVMAITICAAAVLLCVIGIIIISLLRWMGFEM